MERFIWPTRSSEEVFQILQSNESGLSTAEAKDRFLKYGPNSLPEEKSPGLFSIFVSQFLSPLIYVLIGAAGIVFYMGEVADAVIILLVLFFNAIVGTIQEGRAERTLVALKKFVETSASVFREGEIMVLPDREVVPGDILILQEGDKVPADARLLSVQSMRVDESSLTGESVPVSKTEKVLEGDSFPIHMQKNMVFKGTNISGGNGKAIVVTTGPETEIGKISRAVAGVDTEVPLKKNIEFLSRIIIVTVFILSGALMFFGLLLGEEPREMFSTVVSLAVSIIPEGLPVVITLVLATGVWRMTKKNVLVKKLQAVEALGQAKVIAVDKTGTLTRNEMVLQKVYTNGCYFDVSGQGYDPKGDFSLDGEPIEPLNHPELLLAGRVAYFCSNAHAMYVEEKKSWKVSGDPTEAALEVFGRKVGFKDGEQESPRIFELPFDYLTKYHVTIHDFQQSRLLTAVGAPEKILSISENLWRDGRIEKLEQGDRERLEAVFLEMSRQGLRTLAFAVYENAPEVVAGDMLPPLTFGGFFGMRDPLREEAKQAIQDAKRAGIRVVMMTGDHMITAHAIAKEIGLADDHDEIITGEDLEQLSDEQLLKRLGLCSIFARVAPEHKLRIIELFRRRGEVVAMTGDGVNDAPSLAAADLGVAMGRVGTEVAKEAADLILLDDNFGNIIAAVEEGRGIYQSIKKVILYLFSTSLGEVLTITGALFLGLPLPVLPTQIIWLNFVTDGFLTVALPLEPKEIGLLNGQFKKPSRYILDNDMVLRMIFMGCIIALGSLYAFSQYLDQGIEKALTISLTTLAIFQWFNAWNSRSETRSVFSDSPLKNPSLIGATFLVIFLQIFAVYNPFMQTYLHTVPLVLGDWIFAIVIASSILVFEEVRKLAIRLIRRFAA